MHYFYVLLSFFIAFIGHKYKQKIIIYKKSRKIQVAIVLLWVEWQLCCFGLSGNCVALG